MGIRDILKQREEARNSNTGGGQSDLPEGVKRYIQAGSFGEINKEGKTVVLLAKPDDWFFYFVHEDKVYEGKTIHKFQKHTCLHSPKSPAGDDILKFARPKGDVCPSCKVGAKRKMFAMIPVFDPEYGTYRVIDLTEFHINNLIDDIEKAEEMAREFQPDYTLAGKPVHIKQVDKSFSLGKARLDISAEMQQKIDEASKTEIEYEELAHFRDVDNIVELLNEADDSSIDKTKLPDAIEKADDSDSGFANGNEEKAENYGF